MRVEIKSLHSESSVVYEGSESEIKKDLFYRFPWLAKRYGLHASADILIQALNETQAIDVSTDSQDIEVTDFAKSEVIRAHLGHTYELDAAIKAATFLSGVRPTEDAVRAARRSTDDPYEVALIACGLPLKELKALKAVIDMSDIKKSETPFKKRDLDPSLGYKISHKTTEYTDPYDDTKFNVHSISVHTSEGKEVGRAKVGKSTVGDFSVSNDIVVDPEHRRKGLASAIYQYAENLIGHKMRPSYGRTKDGEALWDSPGRKFGKSEGYEPPQTVQALTESGKEFADAVRAAAKSRDIKFVDLGGVHSGGSLLASTPDNSTILLKPGAVGNSQSGANDSSGSQPKRESAFYAASGILGIQESIPETHLLLLDGIEYSAIQLLPWDFHDMNEMKSSDPSGPHRLMALYLHNGDVHKWAAVDYILGNPDRNAGNIMVRADVIKLIDHGSSFDGENFDPVHDNRSFVPFYLRLFVPDWNDLSASDKFKSLPRVSTELNGLLKTWINSLDSDAMAAQISRYGIDPAPSVSRLQKLKALMSSMAADLAINSLWTL